MFKRILVANRGEIACRVMRTAQKMGIETVAVYSDADADAPHVRMADHAVAIGPAPSAESYLIADKIIAAAKETGADAIHPGYGFLSENKSFAEALKAADIAFIGPPPNAIADMGDKITSKKLAKEAGVSTVPGYLGEIADADEAVRIATEIGFPVMIKASAGGGGKGMRIARSEDEVREGLASAINEARSSFGDERVFIEKFVENPRHIEIQILADSHGNVLYLGERECSIQRRHQKVLEEAPSSFLDEKTRQAMGEQAVALSKAVDYTSAGTVEFIVDKDKNFYFLEMNTRLQVEHPVTECITGLDLVEQMIRVANGEKLPLTQSEVTLTGWAVEARVYAEDPLRNFLPSIGRLTSYEEPTDYEGIRVDSGITEGSEISMFYDPMISKLIAYADDRATAIERLKTALDAYVIRGVGHNAAFLAATLDHHRFKSGDTTTQFIQDEYPEGFHGRPLSDQDKIHFGLVAALANYRLEQQATEISGRLTGHEAKPNHAVTTFIGQEGVAITHTTESDDFGTVMLVQAQVGDQKFDLNCDWTPGQDICAIQINGTDYIFQIQRKGAKWHLYHQGKVADIIVLPTEHAGLMVHMPEKLPPDMSNFLLSPMPGLLMSVAVSEGDKVEAGQVLCVVEAMKMENILRAEKEGVVKKIYAEAGDNLAVDQKIIEFDN